MLNQYLVVALKDQNTGIFTDILINSITKTFKIEDSRLGELGESVGRAFLSRCHQLLSSNYETEMSVINTVHQVAWEQIVDSFLEFEILDVILTGDLNYIKSDGIEYAIRQRTRIY